MTVPATTWSETTPAGSDNIAQGDDRIRELKAQVREIIAVDHEMTSTQSAATGGQHKQVTLQEQADLGTGAVGATILGNQTVSGEGELVYTDEGDTDVQITSLGKLNAAALGGVYGAPAAVADLVNILPYIYPVGSVYTNAAVSTNPATLFGFGTWVAIEGECVVGLVAGGYFDTLGSVPEGAATVKLTGGESGTSAHTHDITTSQVAAGSSNLVAGYNTRTADQTVTAGALASTEADADDAHNNIQPSYVCYVWRRTV